MVDIQALQLSGTLGLSVVLRAVPLERRKGPTLASGAVTVTLSTAMALEQNKNKEIVSAIFRIEKIEIVLQMDHM